MIDIKPLEEIGLTKSEIKVYLALLESGSSSTGPIVERSRIASSKIYEIVEKLIHKGLASFVIKRGIKYFEAASPDRIMDYMKEKEERIVKQREQLKKIIPELKLKQSLSKYQSQAKIFKGIEGIRTAYEDILTTLKPGEEYYISGAMQPQEPYFTFIRNFQVRRAEKRIKVKILYSSSIEAWAKNISKLPLTTIKFAPQELLASSFIIIYSNRIMIIFGSEHDLTLFRIESQEVADSFKSQFEFIWNNEVSVLHGDQNVYNAFDAMLEELNNGEEYYVLGASWKGQKASVDPFYVDFHRRRIINGVRAKFLFVSGTEKMVHNYNEIYNVLGEVKFLPLGIYEGIQFNLYKNKIIMFVWRKKNPVIFRIEDKEIYKTFKTYFDNLWKTVK